MYMYIIIMCQIFYETCFKEKGVEGSWKVVKKKKKKKTETLRLLLYIV